jgi:hypothetical protein
MSEAFFCCETLKSYFDLLSKKIFTFQANSVKWIQNKRQRIKEETFVIKDQFTDTHNLAVLSPLPLGSYLVKSPSPSPTFGLGFRPDPPLLAVVRSNLPEIVSGCIT